MVRHMRRMISSAVLLVAACATAPIESPVGAPNATSAPPNAGDIRAARLLAAAGQADAPTRALIEREFGQADIARQEGAGLSLTYRLPTCALLLLFTANERDEMRLQQAHVSPRRSGDALPTLERCAAEASARRR